MSDAQYRHEPAVRTPHASLATQRLRTGYGMQLVYEPTGEIIGFLKPANEYGWCYALKGADWSCRGYSLDDAFDHLVSDHAALTRGRTP